MRATGNMIELMTLDEVAGYLRITRRTIYRLLKDDEIPAIKVGRQWRFDRNSIDEWLHQKSTKSSGSILIIDDDESIRSLFIDTLESSRLNVTAAGDSYQGLELIKMHDYDLVFIDLKMPGMDGAELFKHIREIKPELPVTIITGYRDSDLMTNALTQGPLGVLSKPFSSMDIQTAVNNYLRFGTRVK